MTIVSIDPGTMGALCILRGGELSVHKAGTTPRDTCDVLEQALADSYAASFGGSPGSPDIRVVMERVRGFIGGGAHPSSAMFNFGCGYGVYIGILTALKIPFELVDPASWQKGLSLGSRGLQKANIHAGMTDQQRADEKRRVSQINVKLKAAWKHRLRDVAQQMFPQVKVTLQLADALLILEWARRRENAPMAKAPEQPQKELAIP